MSDAPIPFDSIQDQQQPTKLVESIENAVVLRESLFQLSQLVSCCGPPFPIQLQMGLSQVRDLSPSKVPFGDPVTATNAEIKEAIIPPTFPGHARSRRCATGIGYHRIVLKTVNYAAHFNGKLNGTVTLVVPSGSKSSI